MDSRDMREFYLYPYKELIENDDLPSIMSSYNAVNGVPTSASTLYLDTIARRTYGMKGYVTGDCAAIEDIFTGHYYVETAEEATAAGLKAGVDSDCGSIYQRAAINALEQGLITMADIDRALVNVFTIRMRTGEFDPEPRVPYALYPASTVNAERYQALAEETGISDKLILKWANHADLFRVKGVGPQFAELLEAAGVDTVKELAHRKAENLAAKMVEVNEEKKLVRRVPVVAEVQKMVDFAKELQAVLTY